MRASAETFKNASRMMDEEDISVGGDFRGMTPIRGFTPGPNGDLSRRNSKKERRFNGNGNGNMDKAMSPQRQMDKAMSPRPSEKAMSPRPLEKAMSPRPVIQEAPEERLQPEQKSTSSTADQKEQPPQSYLALTKLGGPEKNPESKTVQAPSPQGMNKQVKRNQQQDATTTAPSGGGFYTFLKSR